MNSHSISRGVLTVLTAALGNVWAPQVPAARPMPRGPLSIHVENTFTNGQYAARTLEQDTILYRAGKADTELGQYFSTDPPTGAVDVRVDKAVPHAWPDGTPAPLDTGYAVKIPAGTTVYEGTAASQGGLFMGGTNQTFVPTPWNIPGVQVMQRWLLGP